MIFFKKLFKSPLTSADLHALAARNLAQPPLPKELYDACASLVGKKGISFLDFWRKHFSAQLEEIAALKTWQLQRAQLLQFVLIEQGWRTAYVCIKDIASPEVWGHLVENVEHFKTSPKEAWHDLMFQHYIMSILSESCLTELVGKAFTFDRIKQAEIKLHGGYDKQIKELDLHFGVVMSECVANYEDEAAHAIAAMKEDIINPLISEQYKLLSLMAE